MLEFPESAVAQSNACEFHNTDRCGVYTCHLKQSFIYICKYLLYWGRGLVNMKRLCSWDEARYLAFVLVGLQSS
jgi:hypothetical protein